MPVENLVSVSFTQEELTKIDNAIKEIEGVLEGKTLNLTPGNMDALPSKINSS